jgi:hypothetical protein
VVNDKDNDVVYTIRIKGNTFRPKVFEPGKYSIRVGEGENAKVIQGVESMPLEKDGRLDINLK